MQCDIRTLKRWRNWRQILEAYLQGQTDSEIAETFRITQDEVNNIIKTIKEIEGLNE